MRRATPANRCSPLRDAAHLGWDPAANGFPRGATPLLSLPWSTPSSDARAGCRGPAFAADPANRDPLSLMTRGGGLQRRPSRMAAPFPQVIAAGRFRCVTYGSYLMCNSKSSCFNPGIKIRTPPSSARNPLSVCMHMYECFFCFVCIFVYFLKGRECNPVVGWVREYLGRVAQE